MAPVWKPVACAAFVSPELLAALICSNSSSAVVAPVLATSSDFNTCTGKAVSALMPLIEVPVTTTSWRGAAPLGPAPLPGELCAAATSGRMAIDTAKPTTKAATALRVRIFWISLFATCNPLLLNRSRLWIDPQTLTIRLDDLRVPDGPDATGHACCGAQTALRSVARFQCFNKPHEK